MHTPVDQTRFTTADGLSLAAEAAGPAEAPLVLLLHGGGQTRNSWAASLPRFARAGYRAIALDARGHGESDWSPDGDYALSLLAQDVAEVVRTLDRPAALVGASMGGLAALTAIGLGLAPHAQSLALVDITLRPAREGVNRIVGFMTAHPRGFASLDEAAAAIAAYNPARTRPASAEGLGRILRRRDDGRYYWHWDPAFIRPNPGGMEAWAASLVDAAHRVAVPTLLIRGADSDIVDDAGVAELFTAIPHARLAQVPGAGHMVAGDRNDAFVAVVLDHLAATFPAG